MRGLLVRLSSLPSRIELRWAWSFHSQDGTSSDGVGAKVPAQHKGENLAGRYDKDALVYAAHWWMERVTKHGDGLVGDVDGVIRTNA